MAETDLSQREADELIEMPKIRGDDERRVFPPVVNSLIVPLTSRDKHEAFLLDIHTGRISLSKITYQNRARHIIVLVRLDIGGSQHRNPDDSTIACPHIHIYREGFGDKWAFPVPVDQFSRLDDQWETLQHFMKFCQVIKRPLFDRGLAQ